MSPSNENAPRPSLTSGAVWMYGAQVVSIFVQFVYAAIASRFVTPTEFGIYAIALLISSFAQILSVSGLGQSVARSDDVDRRLLSSLATYGLFLGVAAAALVAGPSSLWAGLLSDRAASSSIALVGVAALFAPSVGLLSGLLRRLGRFRQLSLATIAATLLSQSISILVVVVNPSAVSLVLAPVLLQVVLYVCCQSFLPHRVLPGRLVRETLGHLSFTTKTTGSNILSFVVDSAPKAAVSSGMGPAALGFWNRADVLSTIPFDKLQSSISQVVYPQYRHHLSGTSDARIFWTDALLVSAWVSVPVSAFLAGGAPILVPLLLGPGWESVVPIAVALLISAGLRGPSIQLAAALEAAGRFRWIWITHAVLVSLQVFVVMAIFLTDSLWPGVVSIAAVALLRHAIQLRQCLGEPLLASQRLLRGYSEVLLASIVLGLFAASVSYLAEWQELGSLSSASLLAIGLAVLLAILFRLGSRLQLGGLMQKARSDLLRSKPNADRDRNGT